MTTRPPLDIAGIRSAHGSRWPRIDVVDETTSTNADLLATAGERGDREVLVAEHQLSGRGRLERVWTSPPRAGLLFSLLVRPRSAISTWGWLPLLTGVALAEAVEQVTNVPAVLKWPNDLLLGTGRRKAAGILVQTAGDAVVIGVGLNVSISAEELPVPTATSLAVEGADTLDRAMLLGAVLDRTDRWLGAWEAAGGDPSGSRLAAAYRARCASIGVPVRVSITTGAVLDGLAVDVDELGRLVVEHAGSRQHVSAGDVEHLRPA